MSNTVIVHGPPACGKTRNAEAIAHSFGCTKIIDDWDPRRHNLTDGALHLTSERVEKRYPGGPKVIAFADLEFTSMAGWATSIPVTHSAGIQRDPEQRELLPAAKLVELEAACSDWDGRPLVDEEETLWPIRAEELRELVRGYRISVALSPARLAEPEGPLP